MPLRRTLSPISAPSQPVNTDWQTMALAQGLDWLYPLDGRMGGSYPLNLVASPPQSPTVWNNNDAEIRRDQRLILDGMGYQWSRKVKPGNPGYWAWNADGLTMSGLSLSARSSNADDSFCFGFTFLIDSPEIQPDGSQGNFSRDWLHFCSVRGLSVFWNFQFSCFFPWDGTNQLGNIPTSPAFGQAIRVGFQVNPSENCFCWFDGLRRAQFNFNRAGNGNSNRRTSDIGLIGVPGSSGGRRITVRDWWCANGFRDADFMQVMGGL